MKIARTFYLDAKVIEKLKRLERFQSEFINTLLTEVFERIDEKELGVYRIQNGSFRNVLKMIVRSATPAEEKAPPPPAAPQGQEKDTVSKGDLESLNQESEGLW